MKETSCSFTGHRELPRGAEFVLLSEKLERTVKELIDRGYRDFYAGGALGFDTLCELTVLKLKLRGYPARLILLLPHKNQASAWSPKDKKIYADVLSLADEVEYIGEEYNKDCFYKRNRALVDRSSVLVNFLRKAPSGTAQTVNYAKKRDVELISL